MKKGRHIYTLFHKCTAVFLILALLWLTVSTPFVMSAQEKAKTAKSSHTSIPDNGNEEGTSKTPGNATEEKVPNSGNQFSEEYIHGHDLSHHFFYVVSSYHKCENADTYTAFHGELLVPPPNAA